MNRPLQNGLVYDLEPFSRLVDEFRDAMNQAISRAVLPKGPLDVLGIEIDRMPTADAQQKRIDVQPPGIQRIVQYGNPASTTTVADSDAAFATPLSIAQQT